MLSTNVTGTKQALLELTAEIESIKSEIGKAQRKGAGANEILVLQQRMARAMDVVTACMTHLADELERTISTVGHS